MTGPPAPPLPIPPAPFNRGWRLAAEWAGFAALLFASRLVGRALLVPQSDQECFIGGIAVDLLAHGLRFPLLAYAPNEYDNGSLFSGLAAAGSFALFGRSVLALKLVTLAINAAGAVAALALLRRGLDELGVRQAAARRVAIAVLIATVALAPRVVALVSNNAVGNHAEGTALVMLLLALFAAPPRRATAARVALRWALVALALYLNKATLLAIPLLAATELWRWRRTPRHLAAALAGFAAGALPELLVIAQRHAMGWMTMAAKAERYSQSFPRAWIDDLLLLGEHRPALLLLWVAALAAGVAAVAGARHRAIAPVALALVTGYVLLHLLALTVMAQGGIDAYAIYLYPGLSVLVALLAARLVEGADRRQGAGAALAAGGAALAAVLLLYRPLAFGWDPQAVRRLAANRDGAACSWRFAEGFGREHLHGRAAAAPSREAHVVDRCRSLSEPGLALDCLGGIGRELHWRRGERVAGAPPAALTLDEQRAFAFLYGTHRGGDAAPCADFADGELAAQCAAAVRLECLTMGDLLTRFSAGRRLGRPGCEIAAPPYDGYWSAMRAELLARQPGAGPAVDAGGGDTGLGACGATFAACYP